MSITYEVVDGGLSVYTRARGAITEQELLTYQAAVLADPQVRPGFYELFDGTAAHGIDLAPGLMEKMVAMETLYTDKLVRGKCRSSSAATSIWLSNSSVCTMAPMK